LAWHWTMDDAFISLRYVENFWGGAGLVFNPGERVEGITNIGWVVVLLPISRFLDPVVAAKVLAAVFLGLAFLGMIRLGLAVAHSIGQREMGLPIHLYVVPPVLFALVQFELMFFSASGMETALIAFGLVACAVLLVKDRGLVPAAAISALLFSVHPEAVLIWPLTQLFLVAGKGRDGLAGFWKANTVFVGIVAGITFWRFLYYGSFLPNTAVAKTTSLIGIAERSYGVLAGNCPIVPPLLAGIPTYLLVAVGVSTIFLVKARAGAFLGAAYFVGILFAVYAGQDWTSLGRYFAPFVPVTMISLWWGMVAIMEWLWGRAGWRRELMVLVAIGLVTAIGATFGVRTLTRLTQKQLERYPGYVMTSSYLIEPANWISQHVPASSVIATRRIGAVGFYSGHRVFDWKWGLTDPEVARWPSEVTIRSLLDDDAFSEVWRGRAPDFFLEDRSIIEAVCSLGAGQPESFLICGWPYRVVKRFPLGAAEEWWLCSREDNGYSSINSPPE
ncbi:hypothetical protein ACFLQM_03045, partial [Acidobacteriota bacterium]